MTEKFKTVIGLEIHAQLKTKSKMFCRCSNDPNLGKPNEKICPVCMGLPGTLPVPNCRAIEMTIKLGLALDCKIADISKFGRKHYFYPDLPKGYQISQYDQPFCEGGKIVIAKKEIRLNRIHLEEDAGKLIHSKTSADSKVDLNRAGTPLVEIVTEPDLENPKQAKEFLKELQLVLRQLNISDADMEKGQLRSDANINVIKNGKSSPIVEIKNLNSFKFIDQALEYEQKRLINEFEKFDGKKTKQTRGFDSSTGKTYILREKEEAKDYRYFPEPDIPPFRVKDFIDIGKLKLDLEKLPSAIRTELANSGVRTGDIEIIIKDKKKLAAVYAFLDKGPNKVKIASNLIVNEKNFIKLGQDARLDLVDLIIDESLSSNVVRNIILKNISSGLKPHFVFGSLSDVQDLNSVIDEVISENPDACHKIRNGRNEVIEFLIGQIMKKTKGESDPKQANKILLERIKNDK